MTAVVGILNKQAVAIAADSAVSISDGRGTKIINRANKIYRLSKKFPIAIMIYNRGDFLGTPWDVICKEYRHNREGMTSMDTVEAYKNDFISFLKNDTRFHNPQSQLLLNNSIEEYLVELIEGIIDTSQDDIDYASMSFTNIQDFLKERIKAGIEVAVTKRNEKYQEAYTDFYDYTNIDFENFDIKHIVNTVADVLVQKTFGIPLEKEPWFENGIKGLVFSLVRNKSNDLSFAGLIFIGYGEDEIFPSIQTINIRFMVENRLQYSDDLENCHSVTHDSPVCIAPFAQTDVMDMLLQGSNKLIDSLFTKSVLKHLEKSNENIATLIEEKDPATATLIRKLDAKLIVDEIHSEVQDLKNKYILYPMASAVSTLSKEDLAEMAESLVYLTYLQRRFTFAPESVGGPVDVAIITKGDGFIWIKRKQYFQAELNQHFHKNY